MVDLSTRSSQEEIMDDLECAGHTVHQTLRELEVINRLLGGNYVSVNGIATLLREKKCHDAVIADLGCGGGDILKLLSLWSAKKNVHARFVGIDANPHIIAYARENTKEMQEISYEALNIFSAEFQRKKFDIIVATLFLHHFSTTKLIELLKQLKTQAAVGIVINDIHRHWFAYYSIKWLTMIFSKSDMVKFDAPVSVKRSFKRKDWLYILEQAGITNYALKWCWAFRWQLLIRS